MKNQNEVYKKDKEKKVGDDSIFSEFLKGMEKEDYEFDGSDSEEMRRYQKYGSQCIFIGRTGK